MNHLTFVILLVVVLSCILLWLLIPKPKASRTTPASFPSDAIGALPTAKHFAYFPQIRQALSADDSRYLMETAPPMLQNLRCANDARLLGAS